MHKACSTHYSAQHSNKISQRWPKKVQEDIQEIHLEDKLMNSNSLVSISCSNNSNKTFKDNPFQILKLKDLSRLLK